MPKRRITNEELSRRLDTSDEWIRTRTGIGSRYRCMEETCTDLATGAARAAMEAAGVSGEEIGLVLVATQTPDYIFPSQACLVQKNLQLPEAVIAFDVSAACTGFLMALGTGRGLLESSGKRYGLVIGSEVLSRIVDDEDRSTCVLFGDGAGAVVIEAGDGSFQQKCWSRGNTEALWCKGPGSGLARLNMKGNDVFRFAVTAMEQGIEEQLHTLGIGMEEVDLVICHQANARIIRHVARKYPGFEDRFFLNLEEYGNTSAASIPIALDELFRSGRLEHGKRVILAAFGAGLTWSSICMEL